MTGGRERTISNRDILRCFAQASDPFLSTMEVAEEFDFSQPGMLKRLRELEELGYLESKKVGNSNAWWITQEGYLYYKGESKDTPASN